MLSQEELDEDIREFLIESGENLAKLDREVLELEHDPENTKLISSVFRTIHTIKGTCGFFGFEILGSLTHITESILSQVRDGRRGMTPEVISLVLESVDAIKGLLVRIEADGKEGPDTTGVLRGRLEAAYGSCGHVDETSACAPEALPASAVVLLHGAMRNAEEARPVAGEGYEYPPVLDRHSGDARRAESTIRVDVGLLDTLMHLVGELVLARDQLLQDTAMQHATLRRATQRLSHITSALREGVMKARMQPIGVVWNRLPRMVRDLAAKCGKQIRLEVEGTGIELDKTILEAIKDPLTHIVRNACDHGIETPRARMEKDKHPEGLLLLRAYQENGEVNIEISDDGGGIDAERVRRKAVEKGLLRPEQCAGLSENEVCSLIFVPGFSTAAQVTSISGRGVGMDVVKTNIERIGGRVEVLRREPYGTTIRLRIPLARGPVHAPLGWWCREGGSNPHEVALDGF